MRRALVSATDDPYDRFLNIRGDFSSRTPRMIDSGHALRWVVLSAPVAPGCTLVVVARGRTAKRVIAALRAHRQAGTHARTTHTLYDSRNRPSRTPRARRCNDLNVPITSEAECTAWY